MAGRPRHAKPDKNQREIVNQCRELGFVVWNLSNVGGKVADTLMMYGGKCIPVEIKSPGKKNKLTQGEKEGMAECADVDVLWIVAECLEDVLIGFGLLRKEGNPDE